MAAESSTAESILKFFIINKYFTFTDCEFNVSHGECIQYCNTCDILASTYCCNCNFFGCAQNKRVKSQARIAYKIYRKNKLAAASALSKLVHILNPESIKTKCRTWYNKNKASKQIKSKW